MDDRLKRAVESLSERLRDEITKELAALDLTPPPAPAPQAAPVDAGAPARLADALRAIDQATSLTDILETLATMVSLESSRSGVYVKSGGRMRAFRAFDLPDDAAGLPADMTSLPLVLAGEQIGAVYTDGSNAATVEILTTFASRALEAMTAMKTARAVAEGQIA